MCALVNSFFLFIYKQLTLVYSQFSIRPYMVVMFSILLSPIHGYGDLPRQGAAHAPVLQTGGSITEDNDFQNDPDVVSPIILHGPALRCGTAVRVSGFTPGAIIQIKQGTEVIGEEKGSDPDGQTIKVVELQADWEITAIQIVDGKDSEPSDMIVVKDHTEVYPSGLPVPEINNVPLYQCGIMTAAYRLPEGGKVTVKSDQIVDPIGVSDGVWSSNIVYIRPEFQETHAITATSEICGIPSSPSVARIVEKYSSPMFPEPTVEDIYSDTTGSLVTVSNLVNGSTVTFRDSLTGRILGSSGTYSSKVSFGIHVSLDADQDIEVTASLCPGEEATTITTVRNCLDLPAPIMVAPLPGDTQVQFSDYVRGMRIIIRSGSEEIGDGGGSVVRLTRPVVAGETLTAYQITRDGCQSANGYVATVGGGLEDPAEPGLCEVENFSYGEDDPVTTDITEFFNTPFMGGRISTGELIPGVEETMDAAPLRGIIYHPKTAGRYPVYIVVHGNSLPRDAGVNGYNYLLEHLASHCIVAVSIDESFLNIAEGEMDARAIVMLRHLQLLREWDREPTHKLFGEIDTDNVMVSGHSRGGEAAVIAAKFNNWLHDASDPNFNFGFGIKSIYAIAPVDGGLFGDSSTPLRGLDLFDLTINSEDYFVIHGSHDGDVWTFGGHRTYDRAFPVNSSARNIKALRFVHGANHKQFNTHWESRTRPDHTPTASTTAVQNLNKLNLSAYALATLKNLSSYRAFLKREITFPSMPLDLTVIRQYQDPSRTFINHYEEDDNEMTGSLANIENSTSGAITEYDDIHFFTRQFFSSPPFLTHEPYWLWQQTDGLLVGWSGGNDGVLSIQLTGDQEYLVDDYPVLSFRIAQVFDETNAINPSFIDKNLSIQIRNNNQIGPSVMISDYVSLVNAQDVDVRTRINNMPVTVKATKTVMSTVRIPWVHLLPEEFEKFDETWEILFKFDQHDEGLVVIDEIQASE